LRFSVFFEAQMNDASPANERQVMLDSITQAVYAEEVGFDGIWAAEHHRLKWYSHMSAPEIFLTAVAAKTSRVRIGHGAVLMPFQYNHPLRVAERAATLDILSGGRLNLGAARSGSKREMSTFGVDVDRTYAEVEEALRIISHCWQRELFEWDGLLQVPPGEVLPRPVQEPHPPLYLACSRISSLELAAEWGVGALIFAFTGPDDVRKWRDTYDGHIAARKGDKLVSPVTNDCLVAHCPTVVLDDGDLARQIGARGQRFFAEGTGHWYAKGPPPDLAPASGDEVEKIRASGERFAEGIRRAAPPGAEIEAQIAQGSRSFNVDDAAYGTPEHALEHAHRLVEAGADEIMCHVQMGAVPHDVSMETIRNWGEKIIPHFR
jgi:alkanesulfonate monooxygenase SsuD/methylene tetrahydromethanopterin reductase-like flavin-dependent oxidoreductase (luciferase family)